MSKALARRDVSVSNAALGIALLLLSLIVLTGQAKAGEAIVPATPSEVASTSGEAIVPASSVPVFVPPPGVNAMQPIPDNAPPSLIANAVAPTASNDEKHCLATAIYFEARGESTKGQRAVAEVILARTRVPGRPKTICGVVYEGSERRTGCQFSFTCDRVPDVVRAQRLWDRAEKVATNVMRTRGKGRSVARGATFYHADYVRPSWASGMVRVAQIGSHIFYRPKRGRLS